MLTQNAYTLMKLCSIYTGTVTYQSLTTAELTLKNESGESPSNNVSFRLPLFNYAAISKNSDGYVYLKLGSGAASPSLSDYKLADDKTDDNNMVCKSAGCSLFRQSGINRMNYTAIFANESSETITVREVGLFNMSNPILLAREVLDTPITVEPNGTCTVTMTVEV